MAAIPLNPSKIENNNILKPGEKAHFGFKNPNALNIMKGLDTAKPQILAQNIGQNIKINKSEDMKMQVPASNNLLVVSKNGVINFK